MAAPDLSPEADRVAALSGAALIAEALRLAELLDVKG